MKRKRKWIQESVEIMKKKGTIGSLRRFCGGKVTVVCIDRALESKNPSIRKKAQWFLNVNKRRLKQIFNNKITN